MPQLELIPAGTHKKAKDVPQPQYLALLSAKHGDEEEDDAGLGEAGNDASLEPQLWTLKGSRDLHARVSTAALGGERFFKVRPTAKAPRPGHTAGNAEAKQGAPSLSLFFERRRVSGVC